MNQSSAIQYRIRQHIISSVYTDQSVPTPETTGTVQHRMNTAHENHHIQLVSFMVYCIVREDDYIVEQFERM
jgi:hypothetical protein